MSLRKCGGGEQGVGGRLLGRVYLKTKIAMWLLARAAGDANVERRL